jgi:hypothetical protein
MAFLTPWTHRTLPRAYGYTHVHARHRTVENEFPGERERRYVPSYFDSVKSTSSESATDYKYDNRFQAHVMPTKSSVAMRKVNVR